MKITKRILALVMTMLMLTGTCAVAASAVDSLQAAIDAAAAGSTVTMSADTVESVIINKDLTLDLGGHELAGDPGSPAITINGASVTVTNGHVYSQFAKVKSLTMLETVVDESPAAIRVNGGSVSVEGVRAVGSFTRIPTTSKYYLASGSAVELRDGATATIKQSSLYGRYGVNNKVTNNPAGGSVTIEDAILIGFMRGVKDTSKEIVADGTEKVNAADRIEGFLNKGIKLEDRERKLMKRVFAERVMIYTKSVQDDATVTPSECTGLATVTAHEDTANIWQNNTSTDCSYKYVPEYVVLADGKLVKMTADGDAYTAQIDNEQADGIQIKYRLNFDMQPDIKKYATNFDAYLENLYGKVIKTVGEVYDYALEKYTNYTKMVGDILYKLDSIGNEQIGGRYIDTIGEYNRLRRAILDLGGATVYNACSKRTVPFGDAQMEYYYGDGAVMPADGIVGTIDRVAKLKGELESFMPFSDQSKWADLGYWVYENYDDVIDIIEEAQERIEALQTILDGDIEKTALQMAKLEDKRAVLDKVQKITNDGKALLDRFMASSTVNYVLSKADSHKDEIKPYINKAISIYNHHDVYFTPSKYIDGNFAKAYAVYGDAATEKATGHDWDDGVYTDPTCTEDGYTTFTCKNNSEHTYIEPDANTALGHDFPDTWEQIEGDAQYHTHKCTRCDATETAEHQFDMNTVPATCTEAASITYTCSDCGYTYTVTGDPATGHSFTNYVSNNDATCTADGTKTATCDNGCGTTDTIADEGSALGHSFTNYVSNGDATCTADGTKTATCDNGCGATDTIADEGSATGHSFTNYVSNNDATCTADGTKTATCDNGCGATDTITDEGSALGHSFTNYVSNGDATCTADGTKTATCDNGCGETDTIADVGSATGHSFTNYVSNNDATCTADGTKTATCDNGCGTTDTIADEGSATGHSFTNYVSNGDATCTEDGTKTATCDNGCGTTDPIADEGSAKGHSFTNYVSNNDATCTEDGTKTATCDNGCGTTDTIADANTKLGHEFGAWTDNGENHKRECVRGDAEETAAHTYGDWTVTKPATATEEGEKERVCTECGHKETETIDKTEPEVLTLSAPGVDPANKIVVTAPYSRRGLEAVQLTASEDGVTYTTSKPKLLTVDENGKVTFVRLCVFCRSAVITATTPDGRTAQAEVKIKLRWYHYILFILFGCLWY